jgi:CRISPR-associated protein Cas1
MTTLVLDRSSLELRVDGAALALYEGGERRSSVPMKLLERVVIQGDLKLSAGVLTKLADADVATLLLSRRHGRRVAVVLGDGHNDAAIRLAQSQFVLDPRWCSHWARRQVLAKVRGQARVLRHAAVERPDRRKPLTDALQTLAGIVTTLAGDGADPLPPDRIRGLEGAAARAYFQGFSTLFPPSLGFTGRNRRPPRDPVNAALSLGYTLLHFEAVRAGYMAGLDPLLGFYHRPAFGRESLASDLIEPLRPQLDTWVWQCFRRRNLRGEHFAKDRDACLLTKAGREFYFPGFETFVRPLRRYLRRQSRVLARLFRQKGEPFLADDPEEEGC